MITVLAMSLTASVTLSAILTAALIFVALGEKPLHWLVTLVAIGMVWRGEFWKSVFLESEQQLSELSRRLQKPISSNRESSRLPYESFCPDQSSPRDADLIAPPFVAGEVQPLRWQFDLQPLVSSTVRQQRVPRQAECLQNTGDACPMLRRTSRLEPFLERSLCMLRRISPDQPQQDITADLASNYHTQRRATPVNVQR